MHHGNNQNILKGYADNTFDSIVTDPPYALEFMGKGWDKVLPSTDTWEECWRVLKPGGHMLAFGGTRTFHRLTCAIEDAGFDIRDCIMWLYGSGFPKSMGVSKAIDKAAGAERAVVGVNPNHRAVSGVEYEGTYAGGNTGSKHITAPATPDAERWQGWGTALKPAFEPIVVARKPLGEKTVAANVLKHGTGAINVDACRIETTENLNGGAYAKNGTGRSGLPGDERTEAGQGMYADGSSTGREYVQPSGRWPANVIHDGSEEVLEEFAKYGDRKGAPLSAKGKGKKGPSQNVNVGGGQINCVYGDDGSAARFFYCSKASKKEKTLGGQITNAHPTIKPVSLMRYLCKLVTQPNGLILDPFVGSGSTLEAAMREGFRCVGIDGWDEAYRIATERCQLVAKELSV